MMNKNSADPAGIDMNDPYIHISAAIKSKRLSHAYLICGQNGASDNTGVALDFAKIILCRDKKEERKKIVPCEKCPSCVKLNRKTHPDVVEYSGTDSKGRNSFHANIVREMKLDTYILPNESDYRINLIYDIQTMSAAAANSLLKILEEPPDHVIFIMTCNNRKAVRPTVLSRVIPIFTAADTDTAETAAGSQPKTTFSESQQAESTTRETDELMQIRQIASAVADGGKYAALAELSKIENDRQKAISVIVELQNIFRRALRDECVLHRNNNAKSNKLNSYLTKVEINIIMEKLDSLLNKLHSAANIRLTLTVLVDTIYTIV
ncbi:MAG: hypothetical protein FWG69_05690 [Oscillospiraceae bacterium]|nr:hypothetical protein [Oscillospiraceae bacterium]